MKQTIIDVFAPQPHETVTILVDQPTAQSPDTPHWKERREMAQEWVYHFDELVKDVSILNVAATGSHNKYLDDDIIEQLQEADIVVAMTEFSTTSSMVKVVANKKTRAASMPGVTRSMEKTAMKADYTIVKKRALALMKLLEQSHSATVVFDTGHKLTLDLTKREAHADTGECVKQGQMINFPAGEAFTTLNEDADTKTAGEWPVLHEGKTLVCKVENNKIISCPDEQFFQYITQNNRNNIAELGLGCNPAAVISGEVLEDEKVGLHIAYGMSKHLGGEIESDVHQDIVYAKGCPITADVILHGEQDITIVKKGELQVSLLE